MLHEWVAPLVAQYGLYAVFVVVMLESSGVPMPGETALVLAAIFAGATGQLDIGAVIAVAAAGAIIGDNIGFMIGRRFGLPLIEKYGPRLGLTPQRLAFGQHMFARHGAKIVFFGRFVAFLRIFAAVLAGVNRYPWREFLLWNALGGVCWAAIFGLGGYVFGEAIMRVSGPLGAAAFAALVIAGAIGWRYIRVAEKNYEARMMAEAARAKSSDDSQSRQ
ncbi:MAG: DedA family protein [Hyphomicrobiales bacterium]|nr:DedA family protein [Hyphomicrobiales bacterium]